MQRFLLKLVSNSRAVDIKAGDFPDLLTVYNLAIHHNFWDITRYRESDGSETIADSLEIRKADGALVLIAFVKDAFVQH